MDEHGCYIAWGSNINYSSSDIDRTIFIIFKILENYYESSLVKLNQLDYYKLEVGRKENN